MWRKQQHWAKMAGPATEQLLIPAILVGINPRIQKSQCDIAYINGSNQKLLHTALFQSKCSFVSSEHCTDKNLQVLTHVNADLLFGARGLGTQGTQAGPSTVITHDFRILRCSSSPPMTGNLCNNCSITAESHEVFARWSRAPLK